MSRLFLCGMTTAGNEANLRAMIEPIRDQFDGLCFTFHGSEYCADDTSACPDGGAIFLNNSKGEGRIVYARWCQRHGYSQNHFLYQGPMEDGDHFVLLDTMERISPEFCKGGLRELLSLMRERNLAMVANYGKGLVFRFNEQLEFRGSPHWYATQLDGGAVNVELPLTDFWNERAAQRDEYQWVGHYGKYMTYPQGSNHALLGLDHHKDGTPEQLFPKREAKRLYFLTLMKRAGFPRTLDGLIAFLSQPLTQELCDAINGEKTWQDCYWYYVKGDKTALVHSHKPEDGKVVTMPPVVKHLSPEQIMAGWRPGYGHPDHDNPEVINLFSKSDKPPAP